MSNKVELTPEQVEAIVALVPTALYLVSKVVDAAYALDQTGIKVPSKEELRGLRDKLNELPDL